MTWHPRERFGRREFIGRTALGALALSGTGTLLSACGGSDGGSGGATTLSLARPDNPVTLPLFEDNVAIASGLAPEQGPLRIYNWAEYIDKVTVRKWAKDLGVEVQITTFATMDEAIAKISSGAADFDLFFPTPDRLERMVLAKQLQPLNLDYVPNLKNVWPSLQDPFYDQGSQYTVPYTIYTTGIGYRTDKVAKAPGGLRQPVRHLLRRREQGEDVAARRRTRGAVGDAAAERHHRPQHGEAGATSRSRRRSSWR